MPIWLQRQKYLIDFTLASLLRRRAKNVGLLAVYALIVFALASVMLYTNALRHEAAHMLEGAPEIVLQRMVAGRHDLIGQDHLARIGQVRGVQTKAGRLWGYFYDPAVKANYTLMVPPDREIAPGDAIIGAGIARTRGLSAGDYLTLRGSDGKAHTLRVAGLLDARSELVSSDLVLVAEPFFRAFFGIPAGQYTDVALRVRNAQEVRKVAEKLTLLLPDTRPILREEVLRTYDAIFNWRQGVVAVLLLGAILAFVVFAWDKASGLSAEERREIGILKAVGWETGDVIRMKFWEGALVSLTAFLVGYVAAYGHVFFADAVLFEPVLKGWAVLYPHFQLVPTVDGLQLATLFFFTVFPYTVATIVPIWRAAITDPDTVMR